MRSRLTAPLALAAVLAGSACATMATRPVSTGGPRFPDFPAPVIPAAAPVGQDVRDRQAASWASLQAGDTRAASREFAALLKENPDLFPAEAGLGFVALAERQFKQAAARFSSALGRNNRYVPAWQGFVLAQLELGNDDEAIAAIERLLALDPSREADRTRLELLRFRQVQASVDRARRAREARRFDEAHDLLTKALAASPRSAVILRELAALEIARGRLDQAEVHARDALAGDRADAESHAALGAVLEAGNRLFEAASAYAAAAAIDPAWRDRAAAMRKRAEALGGPPEIRELGAAPTVTRAQLAAMLGSRLGGLLDRAPARAPAVATDVRAHWAAEWVARVLSAGAMTVFPNRSFQPEGLVRRTDLADAIAVLAPIALSGREAELGRWRSARPAFADMPASHLAYRNAALAVSSGAMSTDADGRFWPARPATGAEVVAAVNRMRGWAAAR